MKFYHGTNKHGLQETKKQGYLLHKRATKDFPNMDPCTYLAVDYKEAQQYGDVILEVEYDPTMNPDKNNYEKDAWQCRVYEPIYKYSVVYTNENMKCPDQDHEKSEEGVCECICWPCDYEGYSTCGIPCGEHAPKK